VNFDGTAAITVTAAAGTLSGATLAANVLASSLTSVGTLATLTVTAPITGSVTGASGSTTGNAATATALATPRAINGTNFDGTAAITVTAAAGTLTGATLASNVLASSLTSVGTLASLGVTGTATAGAFSGPLTGNVTGNVTGSSGSTTGNAATATALATPRAINGTNFDGTAAITVTAAAGTLTGATLASGVTGSSLTSVGTLASLAVTGAATLSSTSLAVGGVSYTFPSAVAAGSGYVLASTTGGVLSWAASPAASAGTLTGATLASNVLASSLTSVGTLSTLTVGGTVTVAANTLDQPKLKRYTETVATPAISSGVLTLDCSTSNIFRVAVGANVTTLTISNVGATGSSQPITLILDYSGSYTITWPAAVKWNADTAPTLSGTGKTDFITLVTTNAGTRYYGFVGLQGATT